MGLRVTIEMPYWESGQSDEEMRKIEAYVHDALRLYGISVRHADVEARRTRGKV
jgi:hypothetical protein